jgi:hypothetical protein
VGEKVIWLKMKAGRVWLGVIGYRGGDFFRVKAGGAWEWVLGE